MKYRVTQLGSLSRFRVEVWRKPWFRDARWEVVKLYNNYDEEDAEYDTKAAAYAKVQAFIKDDLEAELRKHRTWQPVD